MLFDLRGRGRRRTVQVIYATLAILLGGGLVFFGIGGDVQGGLFDAFKSDGGGDTDIQEDEANDAREATQRNPRDARAWAVLAEKEWQLARVSDGVQREVTPEGERLIYTGEARERAVAAQRAWEQHLEVAGGEENANGDVAVQMVQLFRALEDFDKGLQAQRIYITSLGDQAGYGDYLTAAQLAYLAEKPIQGDRFGQRAIELGKETLDKNDQRALKARLDAAKQEAAGAAAGATPAPTPTPAPSAP